jgi:hypothetical protein
VLLEVCQPHQQYDRVSSEFVAAQAELAELKKPPEIEDWKALVGHSYDNDADGALRINRITAEYNRVRDELAEAWDSIGEHTEGLDLATHIESLKAQKESLTEGRAKAREDTEIVNWLERNYALTSPNGKPDGSGCVWFVETEDQDLREVVKSAIDAARKKDKPTQQPPSAAMTIERAQKIALDCYRAECEGRRDVASHYILDTDRAARRETLESLMTFANSHSYFDYAARQEIERRLKEIRDV